MHTQAQPVYTLRLPDYDNFGEWLEAQIRGASISRRALALALYGSASGTRITEYVNCQRSPEASVCWRLGHALEEAHLKGRPLFLERLRGLQWPEDLLPATMPDATNPLDALLIGNHWADAIAVVGMMYAKGQPDQETLPLFEMILSKRLTHTTLPSSVYPALDDAWTLWSKDRNPDSLPVAFKAAYLLALRHDDDQARRILSDL